MERTSNKKRSLLELGLSKIPDAYVRAAFEQVQFAVNQLLSKGLETLGYVKAKSVEAKTGAFDALTSKIFQCEDTVDQKFTLKIERLSLPASSSFQFAYSRKVLSVTGYSQVSAGANWRPMIAAATAQACYFDLLNSYDYAVNIINGYSGGANSVKLVVILEGKD